MNQSHEVESRCTAKSFNYATKTPSPLPNNALDKIYKDCGPDEGTSTGYKLALEAKFGYQTLLGDMMYVHITCCPDIVLAITTMSKLFTKPFALY